MSPQPTNPRKCGTCGLEPRFCDCPDPVPAELRPTQAAFTSQGYGEGSVANVPVERRTGERRKGDRGFANRHGYMHAGTVRRSGLDRRSPGGAGLADQSQARGDGGSAAGLVFRLAARWREHWAFHRGERNAATADDARFFLRAIADEIGRNMAPGFTPEVHPDIRAAAGVQFSETLRWLRTEAER